MAKEIFMGAFISFHYLFCLFKVFCHFDVLYCIHQSPCFIFIDFLKDILCSMSKLAQQDPTELDITAEKSISNDNKIIDDKGIMDLDDGDNSFQRNLCNTDDLLERRLSKKPCSK
ncbi:hypothetical protein TNCT_137281 [Trichonephila clavata]|uniref:Uncharacterized protein n=1 Tax=Trichonephila clavata TaxID=2740835 RepID=A0A8X6FIM8_TRICU|nr:hypothetical protein TNCT_137281 [Trichonephila clavata]